MLYYTLSLQEVDYFYGNPFCVITEVIILIKAGCQK